MAKEEMGSVCGTAVCTEGKGPNLGAREPKGADGEEGSRVLRASALGFFTWEGFWRTSKRSECSVAIQHYLLTSIRGFLWL